MFCVTGPDQCLWKIRNLLLVSSQRRADSTVSITTFCLTTPSIIILSIMNLIVTLGITVQTTAAFITECRLCWVPFMLSVTLCWVTLCWVSLWGMSSHRMSWRRRMYCNLKLPTELRRNRQLQTVGCKHVRVHRYRYELMKRYWHYRLAFLISKIVCGAYWKNFFIFKKNS